MSPDPASFSSIGEAKDSARDAQWWFLFAVLVANKSAEQTVRKLDSFLHGVKGSTPFAKIANIYDDGLLEIQLRDVRSGQYKRITAAFVDVVGRVIPAFGKDPRKWDLQTLESVPGVGPKTARWFYLLCNPEAKVAALDTHLLKFLRDNGIDAPKATPPKGKRYHELEKVFLRYAEKLGIPPRDLDFMIWTIYRNNGHIRFDLKET